MWTPGEVLAIDWGSTGSLHVFCAVLAWSRFRFVRFAGSERSGTTLAMLAECFEELGGGAEGGPRGPDGLPERRRGREQGGAHRGVRPVRGALRFL